MSRGPPISPLFPYTTLFRSLELEPAGEAAPRYHAAQVPEGEERRGGDGIGERGVLGLGEDRGGERDAPVDLRPAGAREGQDRKSTRLNSSHTVISYAVFCLK